MNPKLPNSGWHINTYFWVSGLWILQAQEILAFCYPIAHHYCHPSVLLPQRQTTIHRHQGHIIEVAVSTATSMMCSTSPVHLCCSYNMTDICIMSDNLWSQLHNLTHTQSLRKHLEKHFIPMLINTSLAHCTSGGYFVDCFPSLVTVAAGCFMISFLAQDTYC